MNYKKLAREIIAYYEYERAAGHTESMLKGAALTDSIAVFPTYRQGEDLTHNRGLSKEQIVTFLQIEQGKLKGFTKPLVLDHEALRLILKGLLEEVSKAKLDEAAEIHELGMQIVFKRPAGAIVAGGTDLDKLLNEIERRHGKDMVLHVGGKHNQIQRRKS